MVNPATVSNVGLAGGDDITVGGGSHGVDAFAAHVFGQSKEMIPGALAAGAMVGPTAQEQFVQYTVSSSSSANVDSAATIRYDRWDSNGDQQYTPDLDLGVRQPLSNGLSFGAAALNLMHPHPFNNTDYALQQETQFAAGLGYSGSNHMAKAEADYVYTAGGSYARVGGEVQVTHGYFVRAGFADKEITVGGSVSNFSLAVVFPNHQHTVYYGGMSAHF